jgi:hypothetical protein
MKHMTKHAAKIMVLVLVLVALAGALAHELDIKNQCDTHGTTNGAAWLGEFKCEGATKDDK